MKNQQNLSKPDVGHHAGDSKWLSTVESCIQEKLVLEMRKGEILRAGQIILPDIELDE